MPGPTFRRRITDVIGSVNPDIFLYSCNISHKYRYIYVETPKVACSTIKLTLQRAELEDPTFMQSSFLDIHDRRSSPLSHPAQIESFPDLISSDKYFKFCFVRNPFVRMLSCYLDKIVVHRDAHIVGDRPEKRQILSQLNRSTDDLTARVTFREFVHAVAAQPPELMDPHWAIQWFHTAQGRIRYDQIGRFEDFLADFRTICGRISMNLSRYYHDERRNETTAQHKLSQYYTPEIADVVRDVYHDDFEGFGYPYTIPPSP